MIIASRFDVGVGKEEDGEDDGNDVPSWEDEAVCAKEVAEDRESR